MGNTREESGYERVIQVAYFTRMRTVYLGGTPGVSVIRGMTMDDSRLFG